MTTPLDELRRENERLKQELTRLAQRNAVLVCECDELRERLKRSNHALDALAGYAAPE